MSDDRTGEPTAGTGTGAGTGGGGDTAAAPAAPRPRLGRRPGRRPRPGPDASEFAWAVWRTNEQVADLLEQYPAGEERQRAASLMYRDADGTVRTRHRLLRAVPADGSTTAATGRPATPD